MVSSPRSMAYTWPKYASSNCLAKPSRAFRHFLSSLAIWGFRDDARGPSLSAVVALLGAFPQWRYRTRRRRDGDSSWYSATCRFSACWSGPVSGARILGSKQRSSRSANHERGPTWRATSGRKAGSFAAIQLQIFKESRSVGSRITALEQQTAVHRLANQSPTFLGALHMSPPGIAPIAEARRLAEFGTGSGNPANVTRRPALADIQALPRPNTTPSRAPPGMGGSFSRRAMSLESRQELSRRQAETGVDLMDTFAASVEEFDSLIADAQGLGGHGRPGGHRDGGIEMLARITRTKECHPQVIIQSHDKRVKAEMRVLWRLMGHRTARRSACIVASWQLLSKRRRRNCPGQFLQRHQTLRIQTW